VAKSTRADRKLTAVPPNAPRHLTTAEALVETLLAHGIDTVYGLPGLHNDPLFDAFHGARDRLRVLHARHEQTSAYMALGAALATNRPQAFAVVPGPGFLNASAALLSAYAMNAPVIGIIGQIPQGDIDRGFGHLHELRDQLGIAGHFAKFTARIRAPHEAPDITRAAIASTLSGVPRPAVLECAMDVWGRRGAVALSAAAELRHAPVDDDLVAAAAKLLGNAERPLIVVGGGAQGASAEITRIAELLEAPVAAFRRGHGVLSARHRLAINLPIAHRLWRSADVVLAIGTRLHWQQANWGLDPGLKVVRIDVDPETPARYAPPAVALVGESHAYTAALLEALPRFNRKRAARDADLAPHRAWLAERLSKLEPQMGYLAAMRRALPDDGIFVDEVTQLGFAARLAFPVYRPRTYLSAGHQDSLGWGLGVALGAKVACPDRPVLAIAGDGGFMYQLGDLATAVQHAIPVVFVVFDNAMFGNVKRIQQEQYGGRTIAADLHNPDFAKVAAEFGAAAERIASPAELERAIVRGFARKGPTVLHVPVGEMPSPWDMIVMPRLRG
jgi:acetolactate synthase-1/2/3 large subunit